MRGFWGQVRMLLSLLFLSSSLHIHIPKALRNPAEKDFLLFDAAVPQLTQTWKALFSTRWPLTFFSKKSQRQVYGDNSDRNRGFSGYLRGHLLWRSWIIVNAVWLVHIFHELLFVKDKFNRILFRNLLKKKNPVHKSKQNHTISRNVRFMGIPIIF